MVIFGNSNRGKFFRYQLDSSKGKGARLVLNSTDFPGTNDMTIITGFSLQKRESALIERCFNDVAFIYAFGNDITQSRMSVEIISAMDSCTAGVQGNGFDVLRDMYKNNRLYVEAKTGSPKPIQFYYGNQSKVLSGYLVGFDSSTSSAEFRIQKTQLSFVWTNF